MRRLAVLGDAGLTMRRRVIGGTRARDKDAQKGKWSLHPEPLPCARGSWQRSRRAAVACGSEGPKGSRGLSRLTAYTCIVWRLRSRVVGLWEQHRHVIHGRLRADDSPPSRAACPNSGGEANYFGPSPSIRCKLIITSSDAGLNSPHPPRASLQVLLPTHATLSLSLSLCTMRR